jgi:hypothetical protein
MRSAERRRSHGPRCERRPIPEHDDMTEPPGDTFTPRPLLQVIVSTVVDATAAGAGWLAAVVDGTELAVVAAAAEEPGRVRSMLWQRTGLGSGTAGFVVQSGQPVALQPGGSSTDEWAETLLGRGPTGLLCVPCLDEDQCVGALELVDKAGGGPFSFDDVEITTLVGQIAGAALAEGVGASRVPAPDQLAGDLGRLATADPSRYAALARAVGALLGQA